MTNHRSLKLFLIVCACCIICFYVFVRTHRQYKHKQKIITSSSCVSNQLPFHHLLLCGSMNAHSKSGRRNIKKHINLTSAQNLHLWKLSSLTKPFIFSFVFCCFAILFTLVTQSEHVRNITQLYTSKSEQFLNLSDKVKRQITTLSGQGS